MDFIKPERLRQGDTLAAISLSSGAAAFPHRYQSSKAQIEKTFGVHLVETPHTLKEAASV